MKRKAWNKVFFDDTQLKSLYLDERLPALTIAEKLKMGVGPVYRRLRELKIIRNNSQSHLGIRPSNFKGRFKENRSGYIIVHLPPSHMFYEMGSKYGSNKASYIREHRLIMAGFLGRNLEPWEVVHHKDGDKENNSIENLELIVGQYRHQSLTLAHQQINRLEGKIKKLIKENIDLRSRLAALEAKG